MLVLPDQIENCIRYPLWSFVLRRCRGCGVNRYPIGHFALFHETPELTPRIPVQIVPLDVGPRTVKRRELSIDVFLLVCGKFSCRAVIIYIDKRFTRLWHGFSLTEVDVSPFIGIIAATPGTRITIFKGGVFRLVNKKRAALIGSSQFSSANVLEEVALVHVLQIMGPDQVVVRHAGQREDRRLMRVIDYT